MLRKDQPVEKPQRGKSRREPSFVSKLNEQLWEALRSKRREIAEAQDLATQGVFNEFMLKCLHVGPLQS